MDRDAQLQADIDLLRKNIEGTQDLYLQACHLMFFRYGITPTATKLYYFIRKGSMTTVSDVVKVFWGQLREKSRILVDNADMPEEVLEYAGAVLAELWRRSLGAAEHSAAQLRAEAERERDAAQEAARVASKERDAALERAAELEGQVRELKDDTLALQQAQAGLEGQLAVLTEELERVRDQNHEARQALGAAREQFSEELARIRDDAQRAASYHQEEVHRLLVDVDRHRQDGQALRKQLEAAGGRLREAEELARAAQARAQADFAHQQGVLLAVSAERDSLREEVTRLAATSGQSAAGTRRGLVGRAALPRKRILR